MAHPSPERVDAPGTFQSYPLDHQQASLASSKPVANLEDEDEGDSEEVPYDSAQWDDPSVWELGPWLPVNAKLRPPARAVCRG